MLFFCIVRYSYIYVLSSEIAKKIHRPYYNGVIKTVSSTITGISCKITFTYKFNRILALNRGDNPAVTGFVIL
jgi:hypothetical protein